jgi:BON domain
VTQRLRSLWLAAVGLGMVPLPWAHATTPLTPAPTVAPTPAPAEAVEPGRLGVQAGDPVTTDQVAAANQRLADAIARELRQSGQLRGYAIDVSFHNGTAELTGRVANAQQREEVLRVVRGVPGVEYVRDRLKSAVDTPVVPAQAVFPGVPVRPPPGQEPPAKEPPGKEPPGPMPPAGGVAPLPPAGGVPEPSPIFHGGPQLPGAAYNPPPMPPYAWPTYAPYNNYSRVAYPLLYPYQSWPYIGPMYPFPKVPLGWRSIHLTWQDGHWWYGRNATGHCWWRVRYW